MCSGSVVRCIYFKIYDKWNSQLVGEGQSLNLMFAIDSGNYTLVPAIQAVAVTTKIAMVVRQRRSVETLPCLVLRLLIILN